jgi:hypothetical protein
MVKGLGDMKSVINIKKSHEGNFTKHCKREGYDSVTNKCISEAKKSNDYGLRKQAVFAENARGFKHPKKQ